MSKLTLKFLVVLCIGSMLLLNGCSSSGLADKQDTEISNPTETIPEETPEEAKVPLQEQNESPSNVIINTPGNEVQSSEAIYGTPVIDGTLDSIWEKANIVYTKASNFNPNSATAKIRTMWDTDFLYVYAEITDSVLSTSSVNEWEQDSFEVFIDQNFGRTIVYEWDDVQYRVNCNNIKSYNGSPDLALFKSAAKIVTGGYVVEEAVPLNKVKGKADSFIGVDFQVNDDNGTGKRTGQSHWNDTTNAAWQSTAVFGKLKLIK